MRAALLESTGHLVMTDQPKPEITQPDQVLVQTQAVGICGSEVHAYLGSHPYRKAPVILGHEASGVVAAVGSGVRAFKPGDRALIDPQWTCGTCNYCRQGRINLCPNKQVLGTPTWPGAFSEYFLAPEKTLFQLPHNLSFLQGCLIEPLTVAVHVARRAGLRTGQSVAILGSGSIGGMTSAVCRANGARTIIATDIRQPSLDAARERMGATNDFLLPDEKLVEKTLALTEGAGVDIAFITADDVDLVYQAIRMVRRGGVIALVALLTHAPLQFEAFDLISNEIDLIGSIMSTEADVQQAIQFAASGQVDVEGILTHVLPLEEAPFGMYLASSKDDRAIKVALTPDGGRR